MARNGSGTYSRAVSSYVYNTVIDQVAVNAEMDDIATALTASLAKDGQTVPTANLPMGGYKLTGLGAGSAAGNSLRYEQLFTTSAVQLLGAMDWVKGANIASATTINLTTATGNGVHVTGTTQIDAVTLGTGMLRLVVFDDALTLTHHATNNNLPGAANITTAAGDRAIYWGDGTTSYCIAYLKVSGKATINPAVGDVTGLGANVATALAVAVGTDGAFVVKGGALGTPSGGTLSACSGYPVIIPFTPQASTSGTYIDFTVAAGAKRVVLMGKLMSTNGTSNLQAQLGDAGGIETSGYTGGLSYANATTVAFTAGFGIMDGPVAANLYNWKLELDLESAAAFSWGATAFCAESAMAQMNRVSVGSKALSAELTTIRITTANGTDAFDGGEIGGYYII